MKTNGIVKTIVLKATLDRVWRAISDQPASANGSVSRSMVRLLPGKRLWDE
jgi:hypothetical protein